MNLTDAKYKDFALVQEMLETPDVMAHFSYAQTSGVADVICETGKLFLTGEGSSRIFPAKNMMCELNKLGGPITVATEGARQAHEYKLDDFAVLGASNSGKTKELVSLFTKLKEAGNDKLFGLTAYADTPLGNLSKEAFVLTCGKENAVAATKSVVEQAMFYQSIVCGLIGACSCGLDEKKAEAGEAAKAALMLEINPAITKAIADAPTIYFAGRNNGVAEELTLKTNEITRKKSDFLEGTYAVHGVEEVMTADDVVLIVDPYPGEVEKFKEVLVDGVGMKVFAISAEDTIFPTIKIPSVWGFDTMIQLQAGWNVLVEVGIANGIDLDKPERARKVGNEFLG